MPNNNGKWSYAEKKKEAKKNTGQKKGGKKNFHDQIRHKFTQNKIYIARLPKAYSKCYGMLIITYAQPNKQYKRDSHHGLNGANETEKRKSIFGCAPYTVFTLTHSWKSIFSPYKTYIFRYNNNVEKDRDRETNIWDSRNENRWTKTRDKITSNTHRRRQTWWKG